MIEGEPEIIQQKKSGGVLVNRYQKGRFLGKGGFARCYEVLNLESKKQSAIKIICKETLKKAKAKQKLVTEIKIHKSIEHKHVIGFDHVFEDAENVYIILELSNNHTLNELLKKRKQLSQLQVQYFMLQIIQGVGYLHENRIIHRDLKLSNLMLGNHMEIKIGDFGLAAKLETINERRKTICGTPNYLAPEIISNIGHSFQVDIWSLGVILFVLLYGRPPFETTDVKKTYKKIKECQYTFNQEISVSTNAKNLISRILVVEPSKRLTLDQILSHPFLSSVKLPRQLPQSVINSPLPRSYIEQYIFGTNKVLTKPQKMEKSEQKSQERLLLRSSKGFNRHLLGKNHQKEMALNNNFFMKTETPAAINVPSAVYIKKWVDYSSKYGLGYLLSNGSTGIYFNDSTKMVIDEFGQVDYLSQEGQNPRIQTLLATETPSSKELNKKITLMQYFRKYLNNSEAQSSKKDTDLVYLKKWVKSDEAVLFRLSSKIVQVNFNDKAQIILYCDKGLLLYSSCSGRQKILLEVCDLENNKSPELMSKIEHFKALMRKATQDTSADEEPTEFPITVKAC